MSRWAYVEDDKVVELHYSLPKTWRNVSNFFALENDIELLKTFSWYPVRVDTLPLGENQTYGQTNYTFDKESGLVIQNTVIEQLPEPDLNLIFEQKRVFFMETLRKTRNELLAASDWTQAVDIQETKSEDWKYLWKAYRQELRDLPNNYSLPPLNEETNTLNIRYPTPPQER